MTVAPGTHYYVNKNAQTNVDHEIHTKLCPWLPGMNHHVYLGYFKSYELPAGMAKKVYRQKNGCAYCLPRYHKG